MRTRNIAARYDAARHVLVLTASNEARAALKDAYTRQNGGYLSAESEVAESLHELYEFIRPEHIPGAMTDAPCLIDCEGLDYPDNGQVVILECARVFWFPDYMVIDPFEELKNKGRVEFTEATPYAEDTPPEPPKDLDKYLPKGERQGCAVWIGLAANKTTVPEIVDEYGQFFRGFWFWNRNGEPVGPFGAGIVGCDDLIKAGGRFWQEPEQDAAQLSIDLEDCA